MAMSDAVDGSAATEQSAELQRPLGRRRRPNHSHRQSPRERTQRRRNDRRVFFAWLPAGGDEALVPEWARVGGNALYAKGGVWSGIGVLLGLLCASVGVIGMFGGGYTSIQGVRIPLAMLLAVFGVALEPWSFPALGWWVIPVATNTIQLFARRVAVLRPLWWPSVIFDTSTTAVFSGFAVLVYIFGFTGIVDGLVFPPPAHIVGTGAVVTVISLAVTLVSEKLVVGGLALIWYALAGSK